MCIFPIGLGTISRNSKLEPGDIVTEIKMNVGQNGKSRSPLPSLARVPQPIDVSTAPLPGMPRGPPIVSNIVTRRPNPGTFSDPERTQYLSKLGNTYI